MDIRDLWDVIAYRGRRMVIPTVVLLALGVAAWMAAQSLWRGTEPETPAAPEPVAEAPPPQAPAEAAPPPVESPPVFPKLLVASRDIQSGVMLTSELVEWREWREPIDLEMAVLHDVQSIEAILGSVTRKAHPVGTPIAWDGIIMPGGPGFIGAVLRPEMRAVTIEVDRPTTTASVIYPGDRVDVILVATTGSGQSAAQAIVRNVRVLAVGSTILSLGRYRRQSVLGDALEFDEVEPIAGDTFTLEVSPVDAERIALASGTGRLTLAMRSIAAPAPQGGTPPPVRIGEVLVEPDPDLPPVASPVRIIRGGSGEELAVGGLGQGTPVSGS
ncbi:MAG: Flp pilus assembly protein CpaB [Gammaproteobacteria bacterium]|nr:Flp pilus assembly protein CpaB [Gammaproteobacteria bacterium]MDE0367850.1 Flp pilus assembly protein CpaB [Gammaproteobacteria bacterium]